MKNNKSKKAFWKRLSPEHLFKRALKKFGQTIRPSAPMKYNKTLWKRLSQQRFFKTGIKKLKQNKMLCLALKKYYLCAHLKTKELFSQDWRKWLHLRKTDKTKKPLLERIFFTGYGDKPEHAWLKPVAGAYIGTVNGTSKVVFYIIFLFFTTFIIWSNFFEIDEYVHAQGKIELESEVKTLSHFEGGVIQDILVKEGDVVKKDQVLLQLKDVSSKATYQESLLNYYLHWAEILRLKAQINQIPLSLPAKITTNVPKIVQEVLERYNARMAAYQNDELILTNQLSGFKSELNELQKKIENLKKLHTLSKERTELLTHLVNQNLLAKTQYLQSKIDTANRQMELDSAQANISKITARIQEGENKLIQVRHRYNMQDWQELKDHQLKFAEATKMIAAGKDRVERTDIKSPVFGIVHQLFVHTIGAAVTSGRELISIAPIKDTLLVEANVLPQDIGFIREGDPATIKVSAYDYSIYGSIKGVVKKISPDAIQDPKDPQRSYYRVHIRTNKNTIEHNGKSYTLLPGETVQADIITAQRTIMQFLLRPIAKSLADPMRER
jgi:adhesin transport system membrane fusion protein